MAKNKVSEWSSTPANNTDIANIDIAEGCAPSGVNNAIREMMAQVKDMQSGYDGDDFTVGGDLYVADGATIADTLIVQNATIINGTLRTDGLHYALGGVQGNLTGNVTGNLISVENTVNAGSFIVGNTYVIATVGTTDFTLIGASANTVGVRFTATGVGSGNGTATTFTGRAVNVTGTVAVENGGTGLTTLTANNVMLGNGTSAPSFVAPSTAGNVLTSDGTTWISARPEALVAGTAQESTSGTSINFESIPSWVKRINVIFSSVSTTGTSDYMIQIGGDSIETSGYAGSFGTITTGTAAGPSAPTTGFVVVDASVGESTSAILYSGIATLAKISGSTWVLSSVMSRGSQGGIMAGGTKTITGTLSKVRVTTQTGVNTFDSGLINIFYE